MSYPVLYNADKKQDVDEPFRIGKEAILRTLAYFDIFHYPLTCDEIREFLGRKTPESVYLESLRQLLEEKRIFFFENFYSLHDNPLLHHKRKQGNLRAERLLVSAKRAGRFLYRFPFVTAVGISGSLSKNYADEHSDFDFFVITRANRLWIARTLMHLFKKVTYLVQAQHRFCMNYYIDEADLRVRDQNMFTAIEIRTLLPVAGNEAMSRFFEENQWVNEFLPLGKNRYAHFRGSNNYLKRFAERLCGFDFLNQWLLRITSRRWKRKEQKGARNIKGVQMGLVAGEHFAKADPGGFQEKILSAFEQKLRVIEQPFSPGIFSERNDIIVADRSPRPGKP